MKLSLNFRDLLPLVAVGCWCVVTWFLANPAQVFAHGQEKHIHDLENIPEKPEGMIEFEGEKKPAAAPGQEYMQDMPKETGEHMRMPDAEPHDHGGHMHDDSGDPFRTRGAHSKVCLLYTSPSPRD